MAHEMTDMDTAAYGMGKPAWHGLGTVVEGLMTSAEALRLSGLDWDVHLGTLFGVPAMTKPDQAGPSQRTWNGTFETVPGAFATYRFIDTDQGTYKQWLAPVGSGYEIIQNNEAFRIADVIIGKGVAAYETAGSLRGGRMVYITAVMSEGMKIKDDLVGQYLLFTTSHDGSLKFTVLPTDWRVVCRNTQRAAIESAIWKLAFKHTKNARDRIIEATAEKVIKQSKARFNAMGVIYDLLANIDLSERAFSDFVERIIPMPPKQTTQTKKVHDRLRGLFAGGQKGGDMDAVKGTAYGAWTAVTEYNTHHRRVIQRKQADGTVRDAGEARFDSDIWGTGADFRDRAFVELTDQVGVDAKGIMEQEMVASAR